MAAPAHPPVFWRFAVCDLMGTPISILSGIASNIELTYQLNRPAMLTFTVPSEDPLVNILHTDGLPYVACGVRVVKGFRKVPPGEVDSPGGWTIEYVGLVWMVEDQGDGDTGSTMVTCFDHLKVLDKRLCRSAAGSAAKQVKFWATPGGDIIKALIDRTISFKGPTGLDTAAGTWEVTADQTAAYDQAFILPSLITLCDTGTVDILPTYLDATDGVHQSVRSVLRRGEDRPGVIFGYAAPPRTASTFDRTLSMDDLANDVTLWGKSSLGRKAVATSSASKDVYGTFEDAQVISDVETVELLQMLADEAVALRKQPRDLVTILPAPEISAQPINDWWIGDTVRVNASKQPYPETREVVSGAQRVYGCTLGVDDDYGEHVRDLVVSAQAES